METSNEAPSHYSPEQLVTYKAVFEGNTYYRTEKVSTIEHELSSKNDNLKRLSELRLQINQLEHNLADWLEEDASAEDIVGHICDIFSFNTTKEIEFEATATITGTVSVALKDLADFDIDSLDLFVNVDSYTYDVTAEAEVDNITTL